MARSSGSEKLFNWLQQILLALQDKNAFPPQNEVTRKIWAKSKFWFTLKFIIYEILLSWLKLLSLNKACEQLQCWSFYYVANLWICQHFF